VSITSGKKEKEEKKARTSKKQGVVIQQIQAKVAV
jgi:hypothetical protein